MGSAVKAPYGVGELVAVPGAGTEAIGVVSWWRLSGDTKLDALNEALTSAGVADKDLPHAPSPVLALSRAVAEQGGDSTIVRALEGRGNWAVLDAQINHVSMTAQQGLRVYVEGDTLKFQPAEFAHPLEAPIREAYQEHLSKLDTRDVSAWAADYVYYNLRAMNLRDTGGIYFVPREAVPAWQRITSAVEAVTQHKWFEIPVAPAKRAIEGVLAAVERSTELAAISMEEELDAQLLGKRGLSGRRERCAEILSKVEEYEGLLGSSLDKLRGRIMTLQAAFAAAALAADKETV